MSNKTNKITSTTEVKRGKAHELDDMTTKEQKEYLKHNKETKYERKLYDGDEQ